MSRQGPGPTYAWQADARRAIKNKAVKTRRAGIGVN